MPGTLYIVATPIGNLEDITLRAIRVLREVDLIACEDTRHTKKLLQHFDINTRTLSYHEHNERERSEELAELLNDGSNVALVSDAGTPGISDPGFRIINKAIAASIAVVPIPGPSALISALVASGLPTDEFFFGGFLPPRSGARQKRLENASSIEATLVFYEAPHRIAATLRDAYEILGDRRAVVARELTKLHEEIVRGTLGELAARFAHAASARGEIVLLIDRRPAVTEVSKTTAAAGIGALVRKFEEEGFDQRSALKKAARELKLSRAEAYRRLVAERGES